MTKKHYKIQSQESYWIEALSLFTDGRLSEDEIYMPCDCDDL